MKFKIIPIRADFLSKVRLEGIDDQNQPVFKTIAKGGEPCRDVLRGARPGEELILASYCPFTQSGPYKEYGAVYVLANSSSENVNYNNLPLPKGIPSDYLGETFVLRAYDHREFICDATLISARNAEKTVIELLNNNIVQFIIVRYAAYGCYSLKIVRSQ